MPELVFTVALMALRIFMLAAGIAVIAVLGLAVAVLWMEDDGTDEESSRSPFATRCGHCRFLAQGLWDHTGVCRRVAGSKRTG